MMVYRPFEYCFQEYGEYDHLNDMTTSFSLDFPNKCDCGSNPDRVQEVLWGVTKCYWKIDYIAN